METINQLGIDGWQKLAHVRELWDKLDPRDRDILLRHKRYEVNTLCDWKALSREEQEVIVRWFYYSNEVPFKCMTCGKIVNYGSKEMDDHRNECNWVGYEPLNYSRKY